MATVLLVDDDPNILSGLRRTLRRSPYQILTATSGHEALAYFDGEECETIDAVVSDHDMPGMNGVELLTRIKALSPPTLRFMLTGKPTLDMALDAINSGHVDRFLIKPCDSHELIQCLGSELAYRQLAQQSRKLLHAYKKQAVVLDELEKRHPGISDIETDQTGSIVLDGDTCADLERLIAEMETRGTPAG